MNKYLVVFAFLSLFLVFLACKHKPFVAIKATTIDTTKHTVDSTPTQPVDTTVCFQRDILPLFVNNCTFSGCHDVATHKSGYIYTSYSYIMAAGITRGYPNSSKTYTICVSGSMPRSPGVRFTSAQLAMVSKWITMGAPNDTNCNVGCDTTKFTYTAAIKPIITTNCIGCHSTSAAASAGGGIVLDTYTGLQTQALNGKLLGDVKHTAGFNAMPLGGSKLYDCQITQISKWIAAGALNN